MPFKPSRDLSERDLQQIVAHDDSNDEDYDDADPPIRSRSQIKRKRGTSAVPRKKPRRAGYRGSDVSDDDEEASEEEEWTQSSDDQIETNEKGRPVRTAVKNTKTYIESEEEEIPDTSQSERDDNTPRKIRRRKVMREVPASPDRKVVILKVSTPLQIDTTTRSLRRRDPNAPRSKITESMVAAAQARRSRRTPRIEDDDDELLELSSSGRHALRSGSREPETSSRPFRGGKSIAQPLSKINENVPGAYRDEYGDIVIPSSQPDDNLPADNQDNEPAGQDPELVHDVLDSLSNLADVVPSSQDSPSEDPLQYSPERPLRQEVVRPEIEELSEQEAEVENEMAEEDNDDDEGPITGRSRSDRIAGKRKAASPPEDEPLAGRRRLRSRNTPAASIPPFKRKGADETSDFDPEGEGEEIEAISDSGSSTQSPTKGHDDDSSNDNRRSTRLRKKTNSRQPSGSEDEDLELAEELAELRPSNSRRRRRSQQEQLILETRGRRNASRKNYDLLRSLPQIEEDDETSAPATSSRGRKTGGAWQHRSLLNTSGPFGGTAGAALLGGPSRPADADSDSSDDEIMKQPKPVGALAGMTPTAAMNPFNPFSAQPVGADPNTAPSGTPANLGRVKDKQALADADPLGVDQNVDFDSVGGLQGHIDQLKEMVALPLLYPEIFMRFKITPPRGVLFHGPPGTGKTLLARALATSVSSQGRKVTFYMRKGADALSKWVGEAERQLRLLFEEARKNQPSIIFFDEIDGLAPVRSSKQEQIHASIVSTLLALMDGMDGRGQVIVIGATNRPDSIDPALRRPGRFDREFYFPLPDIAARRAILDIHTKQWDPPLESEVKDELAELTKGYGGADLRALCTEAALNAVQRRYPQIYRSNEKLIIDPTTITVTPKDFMISIKKMVPSSERSISSGAAPLPPTIAPLLDDILSELQQRLTDILPRKKTTTALDEALYEDAADGTDFGRERTQQAFETSRVFRPRMLLHGRRGMGQQYLIAALLNHLQGVHVQSFDLSVLLGDSTTSPEATMIRLFSEAKTHKPSVIYIPNVSSWYSVLNDAQRITFLGLLRSIKASDPIMVLGYAEEVVPEPEMAREIFGYSLQNRMQLNGPSSDSRRRFFNPLMEYILKSPEDWPDPVKRKKRQLEVLIPAPPERPKTPPPPTKEELKAQRKKDRQTLNMLKIRLQPIMDQIRMRHKKFRTGVIEESVIRYLYDEADPGTVTSDMAEFPVARATFRPYEVDKDSHGIQGLRDQANGKFFYNLDTVTIEKRLSNGYYKRPKDYLADIKRLAKDAKAIEDEERLLKANELLANVEVDIATIEMNEPALITECERVFEREMQREKQTQKEDAQRLDLTMPDAPRTIQASFASAENAESQEEVGQIQLGMGLDNPKDTLGSNQESMLLGTSSESATFTNGDGEDYGSEEYGEYEEYEDHEDDGHGGQYDDEMEDQVYEEPLDGQINEKKTQDQEYDGETEDQQYEFEDDAGNSVQHVDQSAEEYVEESDDVYDDEHHSAGDEVAHHVQALQSDQEAINSGDEDQLYEESGDKPGGHVVEDIDMNEVEFADQEGSDESDESEETDSNLWSQDISHYSEQFFLNMTDAEEDTYRRRFYPEFYGDQRPTWPTSFEDMSDSSTSTEDSAEYGYPAQTISGTLQTMPSGKLQYACGFMLIPQTAFTDSGHGDSGEAGSEEVKISPEAAPEASFNSDISEEGLSDARRVEVEALNPGAGIFSFVENIREPEEELPSTQSTEGKTYRYRTMSVC